MWWFLRWFIRRWFEHVLLWCLLLVYFDVLMLLIPCSNWPPSLYCNAILVYILKGIYCHNLRPYSNWPPCLNIEMLSHLKTVCLLPNQWQMKPTLFDSKSNKMCNFLWQWHILFHSPHFIYRVSNTTDMSTIWLRSCF